RASRAVPNPLPNANQLASRRGPPPAVLVGAARLASLVASGSESCATRTASLRDVVRPRQSSWERRDSLRLSPVVPNPLLDASQIASRGGPVPSASSKQRASRSARRDRFWILLASSPISSPQRSPDDVRARPARAARAP